jgi:hypothetical protein
MVQPGLSGNPFFCGWSSFGKKDWERKTEIAAQKLNVFTSVEIIIFDDGINKFAFGERNVVSIKF